MATQKSTQTTTETGHDMPLPRPIPRRSAATIHAHALCVLDEWNGEQEKIYCVAAGGKALCNDTTTVQRNLFTVIEDIAGHAVLLRSLRNLISELAQAAGSDHVAGTNHG